jgi:hypothetical protein
MEQRQSPAGSGRLADLVSPGLAAGAGDGRTGALTAPKRSVRPLGLSQDEGVTVLPGITAPQIGSAPDTRWNVVPEYWTT